MRYFINLLLLILSTKVCAQEPVVRLIKTIEDPGSATNLYVSRLGNSMAIVSSSGRAWLCRSDGTFLTDTVYKNIESSSSRGVLIARKKVGAEIKYGFLGLDGKEKTLFEFDHVEDFKFGRALVKKKSSYWLMDSLFRMVPVPGEYYSLKMLTPDLISAQKQKGWSGIIRFDGTVLVPFLYGEFFPSRDYQFFRAFKGPYSVWERRNGLIDHTGKVIIPIHDQEIKVWDHYIAVERSDTLLKDSRLYYDLKGTVMAAAPNERATPETRPYIAMKQYANGKIYGLKDSVTGQLLTPMIYDNITSVKFGLLEFKKQGYIGLPRMGYMNFKGEVILERNFGQTRVLTPHDILFFRDRNKGPWQWYDGNGKEIFASPIKKTEPFLDSRILPNDTTRIPVLAVSLEGKKIGLYNRSGGMILPEEYDTLIYLSYRTLYFRKGAESGLMNTSGKILMTNPKGKMLITGFLTPKSTALIRIFSNGRSGVITDTGKVLLAPEFETYEFHWFNQKYLWCPGKERVHVFVVEE